MLPKSDDLNIFEFELDIWEKITKHTPKVGYASSVSSSKYTSFHLSQIIVFDLILFLWTITQSNEEVFPTHDF